MKEQFERTSLLIGEEAINKLNNSKVLIFGVGGVGGYVAEALARTGVGSITIVDKDTVSESNINRQIIALHSTVGRDKVDVLKERMLDINPNLQVDAKKCFFLPENAHEFDFSQYDYIVDAVDTVTAKLQIIVQAKEAGVPVISAMGAGNKVHPEMFEIADIYKTEMCPLAKVMRRELKNRGIKKLKVVYSKEKPVYKGDVPGSIAFSPSVAGLLMASEVVRELCEVK
jgi:tRNA A37 threonylcarbamoyladenosine dehydratase